ncbi:hypothetical protein Pmani_018961 [Petrolisthes manimaculis]|uniref:Uncharacterized protein n=1 Tax=Petrolisthes manimaculis TaxID=1843537 RepID=A0AAE1U879_9EUCA|nr:hypothetical protein Pmani_018961 [Petrolisthes manimaculis]
MHLLAPLTASASRVLCLESLTSRPLVPHLMSSTPPTYTSQFYTLDPHLSVLHPRPTPSHSIPPLTSYKVSHSIHVIPDLLRFTLRPISLLNGVSVLVYSTFTTYPIPLQMLSNITLEEKDTFNRFAVHQVYIITKALYTRCYYCMMRFVV